MSDKMNGKMSDKKFERNERVLEILECVGKVGFILFLGVAAPNASGHIIKMLGWVPDYKNRYGTEKALKSLENKKLVKFWFKNGKGKIVLTKEGRLHLASLKVKLIKFPRGVNWDGQWRIVTFDIPVKLNANRRRFTRALEVAGMFNLERSLLVYPHECRDQVYKIADLYEVRKYIRYIVARSVEPDHGLKRNFPFTVSRKTS